MCKAWKCLSVLWSPFVLWPVQLSSTSVLCMRAGSVFRSEGRSSLLCSSQRERRGGSERGKQAGTSCQGGSKQLRPGLSQLERILCINKISIVWKGPLLKCFVFLKGADCWDLFPGPPWRNVYLVYLASTQDGCHLTWGWTPWFMYVGY